MSMQSQGHIEFELFHFRIHIVCVLHQAYLCIALLAYDTDHHIRIATLHLINMGITI